MSRPAASRHGRSLGVTYAGSGLVTRARELLTAGPADSVTLVGHVCALPSPPLAVAEHLAHALLSGDPSFLRSADGRWRLADAEVARPRARESGAADLLRRLTWVVVDVETTGTRVWRGDRVTEVAAVVVRDGRIAEVVESLVNPEREIPRAVTRLTNITGAMVAGAPRFADVCDRLMPTLSSGIFVAHNAGFDWRFLSQEVRAVGGSLVAGRRLCTARLARAVLPQLPRRSLDALSLYFGVENHARHRAGGDAVATAKILPRLLDLAAERDCHTWADLQALLRSAPKRRRRQRTPRWVDVDPTL